MSVSSLAGIGLTTNLTRTIPVARTVFYGRLLRSLLACRVALRCPSIIVRYLVLRIVLNITIRVIFVAICGTLLIESLCLPISAQCCV